MFKKYVYDNKPLWKWDSGKPGPIVLILSGVHGDESNGISVNFKLISSFTGLEAGQLWIYPLVNIGAFLNRVRHTGIDYNRHFNILNESIADLQTLEKLKHLLNQCDVCLDLHTNNPHWEFYPHWRYTKDDITHKNILIDYLSSDIVIYNHPPENSIRFYMDSIQIPYFIWEGGTALKLNNDYISICIENIKNLLKHLKMVSGEYKVYKPMHKNPSDINWYYSSKNGSIRQLHKLGDFLHKNSRIAHIYGQHDEEIIYTEVNGILLTRCTSIHIPEDFPILEVITLH